MDMSPAYIGGVVEEFPKAQCPTSIIFSHQRQL
jgi:hypothetical protein